MSSLTRLTRLTFLVTSGERVVRKEEFYVLVRDEKDREAVVKKYEDLYQNDGDEIFVKREWLPMRLSNDVLASNGQDRDVNGYCISYVS